MHLNNKTFFGYCMCFSFEVYCRVNLLLYCTVGTVHHLFPTAFIKIPTESTYHVFAAINRYGQSSLLDEGIQLKCLSSSGYARSFAAQPHPEEPMLRPEKPDQNLVEAHQSF